jgi:rhodanese-related sulfurtransferase
MLNGTLSGWTTRKGIATRSTLAYDRLRSRVLGEAMRVVLVTLVLGWLGCSEGPNNRFKENYKKSVPPPPKQAVKKVVKKEVDYHGLVAEGAILVDVRTASEFARSSVPGAKNVPYEHLLQHLDAFGSKEQSVIVFCESGRRAELAKVILNQQGWGEVYNMGSHRDW